jgi:hypothetical protein
MSNNDWDNIIYLNNNYKKLINFYFQNKTGKYKIEDKILYLDIDNWGIEKLYINNDSSIYNNNNNNNNINNNINKFYNIKYESFKKIYNLALLLQIGNWNTFLKMENYLNNFDKININIYFVLVEEFITNENINYLKEKYSDIVIITTENRGMDIGLFLVALHYINANNYYHDYIIKLHTKTNDEFRNNVLNNLIGNENIIINNIRKLFKENIGMISGSTIYKYNSYKDAFTSNYYYVDYIIKYLYNEDINNDYLEFSAGTFFICKYEIFKILNNSNIEYIYRNLNNIDSLDYYWYGTYYNINVNDKKAINSDYLNNKNNRYPNNINYSIKTNKPGLRDCMLEHGMERVFGYICKKNKLDIIN